MKRWILLLLVSASSAAWAQKAILIDELPPLSPSASPVGRTTGPSVSRWEGGGHYDSLEEMRKQRRMAVGVETFGRLGLIGVGLEMNFQPWNAATVGFGGGPGYNSVSLGWKSVFVDSKLAPYAGFSYSRWTGTSRSSVSDTTPQYLEDKFLTVQEKKSGKFAKDFLVPHLGLQFHQLSGPSAGAAVYVEGMWVFDASTMAQTPSGALGALYYF